jgi:hypothetical protein
LRFFARDPGCRTLWRYKYRIETADHKVASRGLVSDANSKAFQEPNDQSDTNDDIADLNELIFNRKVFIGDQKEESCNNESNNE